MTGPRSSLSVASGGAAPDPPADGDGPLAWFESWLRRAPGAPAVVSGSRTWTYSDVDALAGRAWVELASTASPGDVVAVCLDRSAMLVAVAVALARMGAVYLPLGPRPSTARLAAALAASGARCAIAGAGVQPPPGWSARGLAALPGLLVPAQAAPARRGTRPFYVVLTSGSTGVPKAVAVGVASFANLLRWYCARCDLRPGARVALMIGVTFDPHLMELWAALSSGSCLVVAPDEARVSPGVLLDWLRESRVTACILPTPLAEVTFELPWPSDLALEHVVVGGDRLRRWPPRLAGIRVHNMYGPAESTVVSTAHLLEGTAVERAGPVPIGTPICGAEVTVTDAEGRTVAIGEPGELRVGGVPLALGYLDAGLTAERFVTPPGGPPGARVYRTGDRVRMRPDGVLEFLGRLDDQLKISGVRIEPGEVEAALERSSSVQQAVAVAVPTPGGANRLVAFVRPAAPGTVEPGALRDTVRQWLPEQAVPASVQVVGEFPLTANGKVDREALAAMAAGPPDEAGGRSAPAAGGRTVDVLVDASRALLGLDDVTPATNFLEAGGSSMAAAELLVTIEEAWGVRLRAAEVLRQANLQALADLVDRRSGAAI